MSFPDPESIKLFIVEAIGEEHIGKYNVWYDWDSFCITTNLFRLTVGHTDTIEEDLIITSLTIRKDTYWLSMRRDLLKYCQGPPCNVYTDELKTSINEWFFNGLGFILETVFNP